MPINCIILEVNYNQPLRGSASKASGISVQIIVRKRPANPGGALALLAVNSMAAYKNYLTKIFNRPNPR
jgi:hypothetical protein